MTIDSHKPHTAPGFTIVELLVVIVVIGILAAISIVSYTGISGKAVASSLQSDLTNTASKLKAYQTLYGAYPTALDGNNCPTAPTVDASYCLKASGSNTFTYTPGSGTSPQAFSLVAKNSNTYYHITNDSAPTSVTPIAAASVSATGVYALSSDGPYRIYRFTANGSITIATPGTAEVLVVGGGGGGSAGGGGAGGYLAGTETLSGSMTVTVGAGGTGQNESTTNGNNGQDSIFGTRTAKGGGGGSFAEGVGQAGGSGGGAQQTSNGFGAGMAGQGNNGGGASPNGPGYPSAGGGGVGGAGQPGVDTAHGGSGGLGLSNDIVLRGATVGYAGGGGGAIRTDGAGGTATHGGGAGGGNWGYGTVGITNTGGGGGGSSYTNNGMGGGSGIVIIRYLTPW